MPFIHKILFPAYVLAFLSGMAFADDVPVAMAAPLPIGEFELTDFEGQVVLVNSDRDWAAAAKMSADIDSEIRQFLDPAGELAARYELEGMPSSYLYNRSGLLISSDVGFLKADGPKREKAVQTALESGKK